VGDVPPQYLTSPPNPALPVSTETDQTIRDWLSWHFPHGSTNGSIGAYNYWVSQLRDSRIYEVTEDHNTIAGRVFDAANGQDYAFAGWNYYAPLSSVPEPSSIVLAAFGLIGFAAWRWRKRRVALLSTNLASV
jgi:hypothetical protein